MNTYSSICEVCEYSKHVHKSEDTYNENIKRQRMLFEQGWVSYPYPLSPELSNLIGYTKDIPSLYEIVIQQKSDVCFISSAVKFIPLHVYSIIMMTWLYSYRQKPFEPLDVDVSMFGNRMKFEKLLSMFSGALYKFSHEFIFAKDKLKVAELFFAFMEQESEKMDRQSYQIQINKLLSHMKNHPILPDWLEYMN